MTGTIAPKYLGLRRSKNPREDGIHVPELVSHVERTSHRFRGHTLDGRIIHHQVMEIEAFFPGAHGMRLDQAIRVLACDPFLHQFERRVGKECRSRWWPYH